MYGFPRRWKLRPAGGTVFTATAVALGIAVGAVSCDGGPVTAEWRYPGGDVEGGNTYPAAIERFGEPEMIAHRPLVLSDDRPEAVPELLVGDLRGADGPEVVVVLAHRASAFSLHGRALFEREFDGPVTAGFLKDYDGDGKSDLFLGTTGGALPTLRILNGAGVQLLARRDRRHDRDYRVFVPLAYDDGLLFILGRQRWAYSIRGIAAYQLPEFEADWEFVVPFEPLGVAAAPEATSADWRYAISNMTLGQGVFLEIGTDGSPGWGLDSANHLVLVGPNGEMAGLELILWDGERLRGAVEFLGRGFAARGKLLAVHTGTVGEDAGAAAEPVVSLLVVDVRTGRVNASARFPGLDAVHVRIVHAMTPEPEVIVLGRRGRAWRLMRLDASLHPLQVVAIDGASLFLGPVLTYATETEDRFFLAADDELMLMDLSFTAVLQIPIKPASRMVYVERERDAVLLLAGDHLQVFSVPAR